MANTNTIVKFKTGNKTNIETTVTPIEPGTVYFAIDENNNGSIYFDKNASTRILMGEHYPPDTNTTYSLNSQLSNHRVISTLTGSDGETTTAEFTLAAGTGLSLSDTANTKTITISPTVATYNAIGAIKPWFSTTGSSSGPTAETYSSNPVINARTSTAGKYYAVEIDSNGRLFVNVPWSDSNTNTTYNYTGTLGSHTWTTVLSGSDSSTASASLTFEAGANVELTDDTTNKKITISVPTGTTADTVAVGNHTHTTSITTSTGTNQISLAYGGKYQLNAGGTSYTFTMPASDNTDTNYYHSSGSWSGLTYTATANGGAPEFKFTVPTGTTGSTVALGNHTHALSLDTSTGTSAVSLAHGGKYQLSAGGNSIIFTMPSDNNTTYSFATGDSNGQIKVTPTGGTAYNVDVKGLGSAAYTDSSNYAATGHTHATSITTSTATNEITLAYSGKYSLNTGGTSFVFTMPANNNTTYTINSGDGNGQIKVIPSSGDAYNVSVTGLKSAAFTESSAYAASNHTHDISIASSTATSNVVSLGYGNKYQLTAGGKSVVFQMPTGYSHPTTTAVSAAAVKVGKDSSGHVVLGDAITPSDIGAATSGHTHSLSLATDTGNSSITLGHGGKYKITAGGNSVIFTMPSDNNTTYTIATGDNNGEIKVTPSSGNAYNVAVKGLGSAAFTNSNAYATSGHTHSTSIATSTATSQIDLAYGGKYAITAGGTSYVFTMPASDNVDTNYYHSTGSWSGFTYTATNNGGAPELKFTIPTGTSGSTVALGNHTHGTSIATDTGTSQIALAFGGKYKLTAGGTGYIFTMPTVDAYTKSEIDNKIANVFHYKGNKDAVSNLPTSGNEVGDVWHITADGSERAWDGSAWQELGTVGANHTHSISLATDTGTSSITLAHGGKYKLTAGGQNVIFTLPSDNNTTYSFTTGDDNGQFKVTPSSGSAYNVDVKGLGSAAYTNSSAYATSGHTHPISIATDTGTSQVSLAHGGKYKITAGGSSYIFTMPGNYVLPVATYNALGGLKPWYSTTGESSLPSGSSATQLTDSPAVNAHTTTSGRYYAIEVDKNGRAYVNVPWTNVNSSYAASNHTHTTTLASDTGTATVALGYGSTYKLTAGGTSVVFKMPTGYSHPTTTAVSAAAVKVGKDSSGHVVLGDALTYSDVGASSSGHTHDINLETNTGTSAITLSHGGKYKLTAGGKSIIFTMPTDSDTVYTHPAYSSADAAPIKVGRDSTGHVVLGATLTAGDVGASPSNHTHDISLATSTATSNVVSLGHGGKYQLTAGGKSLVFQLPSGYSHPTTTAVSAAAVKVGKDTSGHVVLGDALTYTDVGAASSGHGHTLSLATDTGSSSLTLSYGGKYKLTAGGNTLIFTMPAAVTNTNYYHTTGTWSGLTYTANKVGNPEDLAFTIPTGTTASTVAPGNHTHSISLATDTGTSSITLAHNGKYKLTAGGQSVIFTMPAGYTLPVATYNVLGGVKPLYSWTNAIAETNAASITSSAPSINARTTESNRYYAVEIDKNGRLFVNVPWTNVNSSYATTGHTHPISITSSTATSNVVSLGLGSKYQLTAGGSSVVFQMPSHPSYSAATAAAVKVGRDATGHVVIGAALKASDIEDAATITIRTWTN